MATDVITLDHAMRTWIVTHRVGALNGVMWGLSAIGRGGLFFVLCGTVIAVRRRRVHDIVRVAVAVLLAWVAADHVLKPAVHRARPFVDAPASEVIGGRPRDSSFPSGHAATAFAGAATLATVAPGAAGVWWTLAIATAYSRVYLGVHYPSDVAAGALLGLLSAAAAWLMSRRWFP